jgi:hypothetical protein
LTAAVSSQGLRSVEFPGHALVPDESDIVSSMSLIASGLLAVDMMPGVRRKAA